MLSDESSSDSETGRFKGRSKPQDVQAHNSNRRDDNSKSSVRNRRPGSDRFHREFERKKDDRENFERSRDRPRYPRYSPVRRRQSRDRSRGRRSRERQRHDRDSRGRSKPKEIRSSSKDRTKSRSSHSRAHISPVASRDLKVEIRDTATKREKTPEKVIKKLKEKKSVSPDIKDKRSEIHKPSASEIQKRVSSPIVIDEHDSDASVVVQPGSYYNMIPAIVKGKSEESSEIDSSDDERLRAKLLNLEKELHKTKKRKHKKKHKRKSLKSEKDKGDAAVEVSSTTDIQDNIQTESTNLSDTAEVTSTQKGNQKDSSEEGEILSDDTASQGDIDPTDLRHKLKRSLHNKSDMSPQDKNICGPTLPPLLKKGSTKSKSPDVEGPALPPHLQKRKNIGPSIPDDMRQVLAEKDVIVYESSDEDVGIGPLPAGAEKKFTEAHHRLEERALEMKIKNLDGHSLRDSKTKSREQWMLELPEGKAKILGLEARSFRAKAGPDMSDRSSWTDTPEEKARKAAGIAKEEDAEVTLQREAHARHIATRDEEQEKAIKKHKKKHKRDESLLELHEKKLKKKKKKEDKDEDKKERRPFSRDVDLQANRFDEAQKKSIIKKAQDLNSRFSRGEAKFL